MLKHQSRFVALIVCALSMGQGSAAFAADPPTRLNHQGRLFDAEMVPVTGMHQLTFSFYATPTGGTKLWTQKSPLSFSEGYYSITMGGTSAPFPASLFDGSTRYLGIEVDADGEMTPREAVDSVPYALTAGNAVGDITPRSVSVGGRTVIDTAGRWTGPPIQVPATPVQSVQGGSAYKYIVSHPASNGAVAHLSVKAPAAGYALVIAHFTTSVLNTANIDCRVFSLLAKTPTNLSCVATNCADPGYTETWINGNLPTQNGAGAYLSLPQTISALLPVAAGDNVIFLNGGYTCADAQWRAVTFSYIFLQNPIAGAVVQDGNP